MQTLSARSVSSKPLRSFRLAVCHGLFPLILLSLPASAEIKPGETARAVQTLEDFHSVEQSNARKFVADADESYRAKLEIARKTAQTAGDLKPVLAAKQAITDLDAGRPPVASDDREIAAIQKAYMAQRQKADADTEKALAKADQDYLASLKKLVADLSRAGNIEEASEVQAKVDALAVPHLPNPGAAAPTSGEQEMEVWKKKALEEFPALKDPASPLSKRVQTLKEAKKATPDYLKNPQWPYLLAQEAKQTLPPDDAKNFNGKSYLVYEERTTWSAARDKCTSLGGQLAIIPDAETQAFLTALAAGKNLWLGASDELNEGTWVWVDGSKADYKKFSRGEPQGGTKENYLVLRPSGWADYSNSSPVNVKWSVVGFICEWPDPGGTVTSGKVNPAPIPATGTGKSAPNPFGTVK